MAAKLGDILRNRQILQKKEVMVGLNRSANDCHENDNLPDCFLFAIGTMLVSFNHDFYQMVLHGHEIL